MDYLSGLELCQSTGLTIALVTTGGRGAPQTRSVDIDVVLSACKARSWLARDFEPKLDSVHTLSNSRLGGNLPHLSALIARSQGCKVIRCSVLAHPVAELGKSSLCGCHPGIDDTL